MVYSLGTDVKSKFYSEFDNICAIILQATSPIPTPDDASETKSVLIQIKIIICYV